MNFDPLALTMLPWNGDGDGGPTRGDAAPSHEAEKKQSIWKRELSFGRRAESKQAEPTETAEPVAVGGWEPEPEPETDLAPAVAALYASWHELGVEQRSAEAKSSFWKRELSFGRSGKEEQPSGAVTVESPEPELELEHTPEPEAVSEPERVAKPSIWKRELSFGRSREQAPPAETAEPAAEEEPVPAPFPDELPPAATHEPAPEPEPEPEVVSAAPDRTSIWEELGLPSPGGTAEPETADAHAVPAPEPHAPEAIAPVFTGELVAAATPAVEDEPAGGTEDEATAELEPPAEPRRRRSFRRRRSSRQDAVPETSAPEPETSEPEPGRAPKPRAKRTGSKGAVKIVGLKLGASQIAAAVVRTNGSIEVLKVARMPLEKGVIVGGEVRDPDILAEALRAFFKGNKLPKRGVRLGIASNRIGVRTLDVVGVDDPKLLPNAVRFRAQEVLPIPLSDAVLDYRVLGEEVDEESGEKHLRVLVAFAYRELVDRYLAACRKAGVRLHGIDLEGFALLRALVDPNAKGSRPEGAAVVTVSIGHDRSIISVSDGTVCEFTRVIEWGGGALDTAVARILALTPSQAEPIKRALTLDPAAPVPEGLNAEQASRARGAMLHEVNAFARELVSSLQFYQGQPGSLDIGEVIVTGGGAHMRGLVQELQRVTGVGVRLGDPLVRVKDARNIQGDEQIGSLALAIGLGIED